MPFSLLFVVFTFVIFGLKKSKTSNKYSINFEGMRFFLIITKECFFFCSHFAMHEHVLMNNRIMTHVRKKTAERCGSHVSAQQTRQWRWWWKPRKWIISWEFFDVFLSYFLFSVSIDCKLLCCCLIFRVGWHALSSFSYFVVLMSVSFKMFGTNLMQCFVKYAVGSNVKTMKISTHTHKLNELNLMIDQCRQMHICSQLPIQLHFSSES